MTTSLKEHWNQVYANNPITKLGWYEAVPSPSLQLIERCALPKDDPIIDIGSGASTLIANLLDRGYQNLRALDISEVALQKAIEQLGERRSARVQWVVDDITNPSAGLSLESVALWHDRAVFHFLTDEVERKKYRSVLDRVVKPDGYVIIATFAMEGAAKCSGLPVERHSLQGLRDFLGEGFTLVASLDYVYQMPSGDLRPYVYACFQKQVAAQV